MTDKKPDPMKLESEFPGFSFDSLQEKALLISIAVSVKRIADKLDEIDLLAPVNSYGETFTEAIQNGIERGQRGISTWDTK